MSKLLQKQNYLHLATAVLALGAAVVYALALARENSPLVIGLLLAAAVLSLAAPLVKRVVFLEYLPFACVLVGLAVFIRQAFDEVGDILSKINMDGLSASWIASAVLLVLAALAAAASTVWIARD